MESLFFFALFLFSVIVSLYDMHFIIIVYFSVKKYFKNPRGYITGYIYYDKNGIAK